MPEEEGWAMQRAITVLILGSFQGIQGVTKSRLPPETLQSLPPLHLHQRRLGELQKWQNVPKNLSCGMALVMKALEDTARFAVTSVLRGFQHNTCSKLHAFLFSTDHTKKCCALLEAAFSSFSQFFFFFFWISTEPMKYRGWMLIVHTVVQWIWRVFLGVSQKAEDKCTRVP